MSEGIGSARSEGPLVTMIFVGAGLWDGADRYPEPVPVPRVPIVGETVVMPDDREAWEVVAVVFDYADGLYFDPATEVTLMRREPTVLPAVKLQPNVIPEPCKGRTTQVEPTPRGRKGMFRRSDATLVGQCIYLMEQMYMESLNGVLCQVEDEHPRACERCKRLWAELHRLIDRYDAGER